MTLSDDELERYARHIVLPQVGGVGQRKLKAARVAVIGAGGIGSAVIPALAGAGVGALTIIDDDVVEIGNLHRQPLFRERIRIFEGRPRAPIRAPAEPLRGSHSGPAADRRGQCRRASRDHDLVIDGSDNFATGSRSAMRAWHSAIPLVSAAAVQFQGQVGLFRSKPCYRCFVGDAFDAEDCDNCAELGVLGALTGTVGNFAALLTINTIVGIGEDAAGMLHLFDGEKLSWRTIRIPADPGCKACGSA